MNKQEKNFFKVIHKSKVSNARVGVIQTPHGEIQTPGFIAVGTNGSLKSLDSLELEDLKVPIMFCNTYHLMLQPGLEVLSKSGGIHKLANIKIPLISDSGGFQVFSLKYGGYTQELKSKGNKVQNNSVLKITEEGVVFRSYKDGSKINLTPESSIQAQKIIGADLIVAFDELLPYNVDKKYQLKSLERTHRWEKRSLDEHKKNVKSQALYAVVHGGIDKEMRKESANYLSSLDFDGFAIGGSVGKDLNEMVEMLDFVLPMIPKEKPNHLLGIGDLNSILPCIKLGVDTFDSSYPTKAARHGLLFTSKGNLRVLAKGNNLSLEPVDKDCSCFTCKNFTIAFLSHLFKAHELSYYRFSTIHNIFFMQKVMKNFRNQILENKI